MTKWDFYTVLILCGMYIFIKLDNRLEQWINKTNGW